MIAGRRTEAPTIRSVLHSFRQAWQDPRKKRRLHRRILEAMREIGILLMAFAPLDLALIAEPERQWRTLLIFLLGGIVLFLSGVLGEMGVEDD